MMSDMEKMEKIDMVRERAGLSYKEAKEALESCNWDLVEAIVNAEQDKRTGQGFFTVKVFTVKGKELIDKIKELIKQGNVSRITIKKEGQNIMSIPVNGGIALAVFFPYFVALGAVIMLMADYELHVERFAREEMEEL